MELNAYFKSLVDQDRAAVVICDLEHTILYMNPAAIASYAKHGGAALLEDQHDVPRFEEIGDALHHVGHLSAEEDHQLIKFMVMVVDFLGQRILQMHQTEVPVQIPPLAHLAAIQHTVTPLVYDFILQHFLPFFKE